MGCEDRVCGHPSLLFFYYGVRHNSKPRIIFIQYISKCIHVHASIVSQANNMVMMV